MQKSLYLALGIFILTTFAVIGADAQGGRKAVPAAEVNGTFRMSFKGRKASSDIKILAIGKGRLRIEMDLIYPYTLPSGEPMVNFGFLFGEAVIEGDTAIYSSEEYGTCKITIKFVKVRIINVSQDEGSECGFGHNVTADGNYKKVSTAKPKFGSRE